jgi:hypothetical protein
MPRVFVLVVVAGALVWAAALVQVDERPRPVAPPSEASAPVASTPPAPTAPSPAAAPHPQPAVVEAVPSSARLPLTRVQPVGPRSLWATASATMRAARDALTPGAQPQPAGPPAPQPGDVATGELAEGVLSPEYAAVEREYVYEPRDGAWAADQENQIRALLNGSSLASKLAIVNCQQTICRVVLEGAPEDAFKQLLQVHGLPDISGLNPNTPYSYRAGQLSVYFARRSAIVAPSP